MLACSRVCKKFHEIIGKVLYDAIVLKARLLTLDWTRVQLNQHVKFDCHPALRRTGQGHVRMSCISGDEMILKTGPRYDPTWS